MPPGRRAVRLVFAAGLAAWVAAAALQWALAAPLGHDEAQYAVAARDRLAGEPIRWSYLSVGMDAIAIPGVLAGGSAHALRALPLLLGVLFVLAAAQVARRACGDATAAWTVAVLAASLSFARRAAELLSDLPAAACLLAGTAIAVGELTREGGPRWRLALAAPWLAAAFYLRYGSLLAIAALGGAALIAGGRGLARRPAVALAVLGAGVALAVPFFAISHAATGSALGILRMSARILGEAVPGQSLVTYATSNPFAAYGIATAPVLVAGLAAIRRWRDRRVLLVWLAAVGDIVAVGLTPVAQPRYIFFGVALLVILGVDELRCWIGAARPALRRWLGAAAAIVVAGSWIAVVIAAHVITAERVARTRATLGAAAAIEADARGARCRLLARRTAQLQWYTGCVATYEVAAEVVARERVYIVIEPGAPRQPRLHDRAGALVLLVELPGVVQVYRLDPAPA